MRFHPIPLVALASMCFGQHDDEGVVFSIMHSIPETRKSPLAIKTSKFGPTFAPKPIANRFMLWRIKNALDISNAY